MFTNSVWKIIVFLLSCSQILCDDESDNPQPIYKYRYETEDMMKTSASSSPVHGYHVVEGGYYPAESGLIGSAIGPVGAGGGLGIGGGQFIGGGAGSLGYGGIGIGGAGIGGAGIGGAGIGGAGLGGAGIGGAGLGGAGLGYGSIGSGGIGYGHIAGPQFVGSLGVGLGGGGLGVGGIGVGGGGIGVGGGYGVPLIRGYGGESVDQSQFSGGKKNLADAKYENAHGNQGEVVKHGQEGYHQGTQGVTDVKGEEGYYSNAGGGKNVVNDGKQYYGGQNFNQEGKNGEENLNKKGHKKGHKIKGYKSSHHKDESGKTEEFYDEEHDEGDNYLFKGQNGAFGQQGTSSYKGGHVDDKFNEAEHKKAGHVNNEYALKNQNSNQGQYGENKYSGGGTTYGANNGLDQQSLLGHQENSRLFKHHQVPFYHHY